jgi:hypothetical protein
MTQSMEALIRAAARGGWGALDAASASPDVASDNAQQRQRLLADADRISAPFRTSEGEAALSRLVELTLMRPLVVLPVHGATAEQQALYAAYRQGQNSIVGIIINALSAHDPKAKKLET